MFSRILGSRILTSSLRTSVLRSRHQRRDMRDELASQLDLRSAPEWMLAAVVEQRERILVGAERLLREVRREQRNVLAHALLPRVLAQVLALGEHATQARISGFSTSSSVIP